jgi:hypothetical protein
MQSTQAQFYFVVSGASSSRLDQAGRNLVKRHQGLGRCHVANFCTKGRQCSRILMATPDDQKVWNQMRACAGVDSKL